MWILTELGDDSIYQIADSFMSLRARMLGKTYVETKLREIRTGVSTSIDDFMDDEILEEMYIKTMEATKKKSANRKRNKKP
jgi:hypothetical protein